MNQTLRHFDGALGGNWSPRSGLGLYLSADLLEAVLSVGEEDEPEYWTSVLVGGERRVGPELVCRCPQGATNLCQAAVVHECPLRALVLWAPRCRCVPSLRGSHDWSA